MRDHLVFTLAATIGSMGDLAGHERRGTETWPGRSAILGLLGAVMGIERGGDFSALDALGLAVAPFDAGTPLRDYHTVMTVPAAATRGLKRPAHTRAEALAIAGRGANTIVTLRDYRTDPLHGVAVWGEGLADLKAALMRPAFAPYLGRRACPLSAPTCPRIVVAPDAATALSHVRLPPWMGRARTASALYTEEDLPTPRTEHRRDRPADRAARHFAPRRVAVLPVLIEARPAGAA
jgi:CRISPR system Cascade subunit CasD